MTDAQVPEKTQQPKSINKARLWRLSIAAASLVGLSVLAVLYYRECSVVKVVAGAGNSTTTTCVPAAVNSPVVVIAVLLVILLLWFDVSEVSVFGLGLKRSVDEAKRSAEKAEEAAVFVLQSVQTMNSRIDNAITASASAGATANVTQHTHLYGGLATTWQPRLSFQLQDESHKFDVIQSRQPAQPRNYDGLVGELIRRWATLADFLDIERNISGPKQRRDLDENPVTRQRRSFVADYYEQLQLLRRLRNAVAHGAEVPVDDLETGIQLLIELAERADSWMRRPER
jgi:hypothetical protein